MQNFYKKLIVKYFIKGILKFFKKAIIYIIENKIYNIYIFQKIEKFKKIKY